MLFGVIPAANTVRVLTYFIKIIANICQKLSRTPSTLQWIELSSYLYVFL